MNPTGPARRQAPARSVDKPTAIRLLWSNPSSLSRQLANQKRLRGEAVKPTVLPDAERRS